MVSNLSIKNEILNILSTFDTYCKKQGLKYVLSYGTLLGAIRHKGFIPWHDDIDVNMTVEEYGKLRKAASVSPYLDDNNRYRFYFPGDENYCYSFAKVVDTRYVLHEKNVSDRYNIGLYIDIFKVDYWPENRAKEFYQLKKGIILRKLNEICLRGNLTEKKYIILDRLLKPVDLLFKCLGITSEKICMTMDNIGNNNKPCEYMGCLTEGTGNANEKMPRKIYEDTILVSFEGLLFPIPADFDMVLTTLYGDYMTPPPASERKGHEYHIVQINDL